MPTKVTYTEHVKTDDVQLAVSWKQRHYAATLTADGVTFHGFGGSVVEAIAALLADVTSVKRPASKNPGKRYRVATSLKGP